MLIHSTQLGDIEINEDEIIAFIQGLPGFPNEKAFAFLPYQSESPFAYLQSVSEPKLTFLVVDPFAFFKDYEFQLHDEIAQELEVSASNLPQIVNIVSVPGTTEEMTANLLAPLVMNMQTKKAAQVILEKTDYTTRHRLFPAGVSQQASQGGGS